MEKQSIITYLGGILGSNHQGLLILIRLFKKFVGLNLTVKMG